MAQVYIYTNGKIDNEDLKNALRLKGVVIAYPYLEVDINDLNTVYDLTALFNDYGYRLIPDGNGYFVAERMDAQH